MQLEIPTRPSYKHGGRRPGAGRKRSKNPKGLPHIPRPFHDKIHPVHVTWRFVRGLPSLRRYFITAEIGRTIRSIGESHARRRTSFRIIHFSIQPNHVHLIVEAGSKRTLSRALQGLGIWMARRVNRALHESGRVLADRYHERALTSPREVRNAIAYVMHNHKHHHPSKQLVDECSSARWFDGWRERLPVEERPSPVALPMTWLAKTGWRKHGLIGFEEKPKE